MREIKYRGGLLKFSVPKQWLEKRETDGAPMFYDARPDAGTLRVQVITMKSPKPLADDVAVVELAAIPGVDTASIQRLQGGNAIATSIRHSSDQGRPITTFWWYVANPVPPSHLRIANFSYTVLRAQEGSAAVKREVQLLTDSVRHSVFHPTLTP